MGDEKLNEEDGELPRDKHLDLGSETDNGHAECESDVTRKHLHTQSTVKPHLALAAMPGLPIVQFPGIESPGIFFDTHISNLPITICPETRDAEIIDNAIDQYHDSEAEDIYDLYNACNGVIRNGLLDVSMLDRLSEEELEVLSVTRLREIWLHTGSGCQTCASIISTLNSVRGMLNDDEENPLDTRIHLNDENDIETF